MASTTSLVGRLGRTALDLVFPPRCGGCGGGGVLLCEDCIASMQQSLGLRCLRCWRPGSAHCADCLHSPPPFDGLRSAFVYTGTARTLVHALKYRGLNALAEPMAALLAEVVWREGLAADVLVPVPLSGLRRRTRGFNQAESLAKALGRELDLPVKPKVLARPRHAPPQARSADASARQRNVAGAFVVRDAEIAGARVLLVDDVTTTGATIAACAAALRAAGVESVSGLAFARED